MANDLLARAIDIKRMLDGTPRLNQRPQDRIIMLDVAMDRMLMLLIDMNTPTLNPTAVTDDLPSPSKE